jgi:hypothetical protein
MDADHIVLFESSILNIVGRDQRFTFSSAIATPFQLV